MLNFVANGIASIFQCPFFLLVQSMIWVQCGFIFALVWTLGGTMTGNSREKFDVFFRLLISGTNQEYPSPKSIKFSKSNLFPERVTVFDYFFLKSGTWALWEDLIDKTATIPADAKVRVQTTLFHYNLCSYVIF